MNGCFQTSKATKDIGALQKGADFIKAFALGFDVNVDHLVPRKFLQ
jgi:rRNA processing protein Krr1/Pno1